MARDTHTRYRPQATERRIARRSLARGCLVALTVVLAAAGLAGRGARADDDVLVFAASSLADAMAAVADAYEDETGRRISLSFASSSALARQIENGAPAAVFVSANALWMDRLQTAGLIAPGTRFDMAGNRLALIAPREFAVPVAITPALDIPALLGDGRLAIGDPDHVPAGIYGREALESLGLWAEAELRLARTGDVRGALALVARGEAPIGIVYATDAAISDDVAVIGLFPAGGHAPIVYPAAAMDPANGDAGDFLRFLAGAEARAILRDRGFAAPNRGDLDPAS